MNKKEYIGWDRHEKMDYLRETCGGLILGTGHAGSILDEIVRYMSESQFTAFYEYFCNNHGIPKDYEEMTELEDDTTVVTRGDNAEFASDWNF
jgi:hypothetical protein